MHVKHGGVDQVHCRFPRPGFTADFPKRLNDLGSAFDELQIRSRRLQDAQDHQIDSQRRLHDQMETDMYITKAVLNDIHSVVDSLQRTVEITTSKIATMATARSFTNGIIQYGWICLILLTMYQINSRLVGLAAIGIGALALLKTSIYPWFLSIISSDTVLIHYASGLRVPLAAVFLFIAFFSILSSATLVHRFYRKRQIFYDRIEDLGSAIPLAMKLPSHHDGGLTK